MGDEFDWRQDAGRKGGRSATYPHRHLQVRDSELTAITLGTFTCTTGLSKFVSGVHCELQGF